MLTEELIGTLKFDATATDVSGNVGHAAPLEVIVLDPAVDSPPTARLLGDRTRTVTAPTEILGTVADDAPQTLTWSLTLRSDASGATRTLATGSGAVDADVLGSLDPTMLANGSYTLTLSAFNGGFWSHDSVAVNIDGALKLGNFTMTFVDLEVPVAGLPITVTRTYDTLNANKLDEFGYGWSLDVANTRVEIQMDPYRRTDFSGYKPFRDGDRVVVTLPDGTQEGFTFYAQPNQAFFGVVFDYLPAFVPDFGVKSQLIVNQMSLLKDNSTGLDYHDGSEVLYTSLHPRYGGAFLLRLRNGNELAINARTGELASITDRNGNTLNFTGMGIESTAGRGVQFERDWAGRITAIVDPLGHKLTYQYNAAGQLVAFYDRNASELLAQSQTASATTFEYRDSDDEYRNFLRSEKDRSEKDRHFSLAS